MSLPRIFRKVLAVIGLAGIAIGAASCQPRKSSVVTSKERTLADVRSGFTTRLLKKESESDAPEAPPGKAFQLVRYPSAVGDLAAYVSSDPGDGKKHPLVIWLVGGFSNGISDLAWSEENPRENDQSAGAYREAGLLMMYPSLRGGNDNPGFKEGLYGEVDDVIAAAEYAAKLPWIDPNRIYLGGHSTGGSLALLVAEASGERFRAVISFGPADSVAGYGQKILPFDVTNNREALVRAPGEFLSSIKRPTFVIEGTAEGSNIDSLKVLQRRNKNPLVTILPAKGADHFSVLAPMNEFFAEAISLDLGPNCSLSLSEAELATALKSKAGKREVR